MSQIRKGSVRLKAAQAVELETNVLLPAGVYAGQSKEIYVPSLSNPRWASPEYSIEFTAEQLEAMGMKSQDRNLISIAYDVTKFVRSGQIILS